MIKRPNFVKNGHVDGLPMKAERKILLIVPAFNEAKLLGETLAAIQRSAMAFTDAGCEWELIVCDNNDPLFASEELDISKRLGALGKQSSRRLVILHRHPLVTSARKLRLYRWTAHPRFFLKALVRPEHTLKRREECTLWYDGRR